MDAVLLSMSRSAVVVVLAACLLPASVAQAQESTAKVARLALHGNEHFSDRQLLRVMTSAPGLFSKKRYHEGTLSSDLNAVLAVYEGAGFLDARVLSRTVEAATDGKSVEISVELDEGPRTHITSLTITGTRLVEEEALRKVMKLRQGEPFRRQVLLTDRASMEELYSQRGMISTRIGYEAVVDTIGSARVAFHVTEGPAVRMSDVVLKGLDKTRPHVVLREVRIKRGGLFRRSLLEQTQTSVFSTGLFRNVTVSPAEGAPQDSVRALVVTVRERQAGSLDLGVGYGSSERLRAGLSLAQTNWRGRALRIGANARASRLLRTAEGVFTIPYILAHRVALDGRLFHEWERNPGAAFRTIRTGMEETFSYQWRNSWVTEVSHTLERVRLRFDESELYQPARLASSISLGLRRDSRDNPLDSQAGSLLRTRVDLAGGLLGGDSDFRRATFEVLHFRRLWFAVVAVHGEARGIAASGVESRVARYEQFYLGGDRSVRGYGRGQIGADRVGELAFNLQSEIRLPIRGHGIVLFQDAGQVWTDVSEVDIPADLRRAHGVGLRYSSRFGMLRLDVALADESGNLRDRLGFYFGVGQAF